MILIIFIDVVHLKGSNGSSYFILMIEELQDF